MGLKQILVILFARKWVVLIALFTTIGAAIAVIAIVPPRYEAVATVMLDNGEVDPISGEGSGGPLLRMQQRSQIAVVESLRTALDVVKRLQLNKNNEYVASFQAGGGNGDISVFIARQLLKELDVKPVIESGTETSMMSITFSSSDANFAALVANSFMDAFLAESLDLKTSPMVRDAQWYGTQNKKLREDVETAQAKLSKFQSDNNIVGRSDAFDVDSARLRALSDQMVQIKGQYTADEATFNELKSVWPEGAPAPVDIELPPSVSNPTIDKIKDALTSARTEVARQSGVLGANHPQLKALETSAADLKAQLQRELTSARTALAARVSGEKAQIDALTSQYKDATGRVLQQQTQRDQLDIMQKDLQQKQAMLDAAEQRASAVKLQGQRSSINLTPIDSAVAADKPTFPKKIIIFPLAVALGLALGVALALLREAIDRRVRVYSDIEWATDLEVLGELLPAPAHSTRRRIMVRRVVALIPTASGGSAGRARDMSVSKDLPVAATPGPAAQIASPVGKMLGDVLMQMGKIDPANIPQILSYQSEHKCTFGRAAVALKFVTESDITGALARQFHYPIAQDSVYLKNAAPELVVAHAPFSEAAEKIRSIRTTLLQRWFGKGQRSLAVLGAHPQAGVTYLAANLALAFAQMGLPTVLVDANMRRPKIGQMFALKPRREGLSTILLGLESEPKAVAHDVLPMLSVIPPGADPPNPQELLSTNEFVVFAELLKARYEVVIYDTPADDAHADAAIISGRAGNALLVARRHKTSIDGLRRLAKVREIGCEVIGTVMNKF